ncbi:hypothetical protein BaRGS_00037869 [Batillaria attramentaria]|uniref:Uncharacterized protein n=1 Tax=Batillaria attramentaria TaxID=370345 RepID=A0ABD0J7Q6_9CAEN
MCQNAVKLPSGMAATELHPVLRVPVYKEKGEKKTACQSVVSESKFVEEMASVDWPLPLDDAACFLDNTTATPPPLFPRHPHPPARLTPLFPKIISDHN